MSPECLSLVFCAELNDVAILFCYQRVASLLHTPIVTSEGCLAIAWLTAASQDTASLLRNFHIVCQTMLPQNVAISFPRLSSPTKSRAQV